MPVIWGNRAGLRAFNDDVNNATSIDQVLALLELQVENVPSKETNWEGKPLHRHVDNEDMQRTGAALYETIERVKRRIIELNDTEPTIEQRQIATWADRLTAVTRQLLVQVFDVTPDEIQKGINEFIAGMTVRDDDTT